MINLENKNDFRRLVWVSIIVVLTAFLLGEYAIIVFTFLALTVFIFLLMRSVSPAEVPTHSRVINFIRFVYDFLFDVLISNVVLAHDVFTPHDHHRSQMVSVPIDDLTPLEVAIISHRITFTPGTLSCVITEDRKILVVHAMYSFRMDDPAMGLRRPIDILKGKA